MQSLLVLAASEDKIHRGAAIAAPNMAWIWGTLTLEPDRRFSGPYHLVWPRDHLWTVQKSDGSFWQNTRVDGTPKWMTDQLDQAALPIVLAWWLGRNGASDWAHIEKSADYIAGKGSRAGGSRRRRRPPPSRPWPCETGPGARRRPRSGRPGGGHGARLEAARAPAAACARPADAARLGAEVGRQARGPRRSLGGADAGRRARGASTGGAVAASVADRATPHRPDVTPAAPPRLDGGLI
jgi:hypothetical protein